MWLSKIFLFILCLVLYGSCITPACVQANRGLVERTSYFSIAYVDSCWGNTPTPEKGDTIYINKKGECYYLELTPFMDTVHIIYQNIQGDSVHIERYKHHLHLRTASGKILKKYAVTPFQRINIKGRTWYVLWDIYKSADNDFKEQFHKPRCCPALDSYRNTIRPNCCRCNKRLKLYKISRAKKSSST